MHWILKFIFGMELYVFRTERDCPKHVEFHSKNKFENSVHLVGFVIRLYHDARSSEWREPC